VREGERERVREGKGGGEEGGGERIGGGETEIEIEGGERGKARDEGGGGGEGERERGDMMAELIVQRYAA
jgi:hypothetical protein